MDPPLKEYFAYAGLDYRETTEDGAMVPHITLMEDVTDLQRRIREGWLSGR